MSERVKITKTETAEEYLARGGKITKIPNGGEFTSDNVTRPTQKPWRESEHDDLKDGQSPNLRWIGDKQ